MCKLDFFYDRLLLPVHQLYSCNGQCQLTLSVVNVVVFAAAAASALLSHKFKRTKRLCEWFSVRIVTKLPRGYCVLYLLFATVSCWPACYLLFYVARTRQFDLPHCFIYLLLFCCPPKKQLYFISGIYFLWPCCCSLSLSLPRIRIYGTIMGCRLHETGDDDISRPNVDCRAKRKSRPFCLFDCSICSFYASIKNEEKSIFSLNKVVKALSDRNYFKVFVRHIRGEFLITFVIRFFHPSSVATMTSQKLKEMKEKYLLNLQSHLMESNERNDLNYCSWICSRYR